RGKHADEGLVPQKSQWANLQELATANDIVLKYAATWFDMAPDSSGIGGDLSGNSRPNIFSVVQSSGRYADASAWLPHLKHGTPAPTRGLAIGDADLDGRLDYIEAKQFAPAEFHLNRAGARHRQGFIGLSPRFLVAQVGPGSKPLALADATKQGGRSRPALGVYATILLDDGRTFHVEVDGGNGHSGKRSPDLHIGLGEVDPGTKARIRLRWRTLDGSLSLKEFDNVAVNTHQFVFLAP
ncbi:MAG: ASPIC/UnbV domain-containing protein, partial [Telluria sp.]